MGRHVISPFRRVLKKRIAIKNQPGKESFEIAFHFGIGIFLDQQRG